MRDAPRVAVVSARYRVGEYGFASKREAQKFALEMVRADWREADVVDCRAPEGHRGSAEWPLVGYRRSAEGNGQRVYRVAL